jgi:hypothetical protein
MPPVNELADCGDINGCIMRSTRDTGEFEQLRESMKRI